jgi:uncharacterized damage-inducible protein DinB
VRQWIVVGLGGSPDQRDRDAEFAQREIIPRDELIQRLRQTLDEVDATLATFAANRLLERFTIQKSDVSALAAIFHVVEHFSMHTGQIIMLTKMFAAIDLEFYDFKRRRADPCVEVGLIVARMKLRGVGCPVLG